MKWLARVPNFDVITWIVYDINVLTFYTKTENDKRTMQNNGVILVVQFMHFASSKYNNHVMTTISYFGVIEEIWELNYVRSKVLVFKCKQFDSNNT